jgi:uncharacterized protein YraI
MKPVTCLLAAPLLALLLLAAPAQASPGLVRTTVTLRAGPDIGFPAVDRIPRGARIVVHGCLEDGIWCDVSFGPERGWVAATALDYFYEDRYVYLPDYVYAVDVPVVTFALGSYWDSYYVGRPWFHRHAYWNHYWRAHPHVATQTPPAMQTPPQQGAVAGHMGPGMMPPHGTAAAMPQPAPVSRAPDMGGRPHGMISAQSPVVAVPHGGTIGLAAAPHMMQPSMGRVGGPPAAMHAQIGGMGHASAGFTPHGGPAGGKGPQSGGGGGHHDSGHRRH